MPLQKKKHNLSTTPNSTLPQFKTTSPQHNIHHDHSNNMLSLTPINPLEHMSSSQESLCSCCTNQPYCTETSHSDEELPPYQEENDEELETTLPPAYREASDEQLQNAQSLEFTSITELETTWLSLVRSLNTKDESQWYLENAFIKYYKWRISKATTIEKRNALCVQAIGQAAKENWYRYKNVQKSMATEKECPCHIRGSWYCFKWTYEGREMHYDWKAHYGRKEMGFF